MKLLLINPKFPESFWSMKWAIDTFLPDVRTVSPPLGLATLAALCPEDWEVELVDENVEPVPLATDADIVGVCGMGVQFDRQKELLAYYRGESRLVVAGGSYASLCPEKYMELADTVVAGEAEHLWPSFCEDIDAGEPKQLYRESGSVSLSASPIPRFDLLDPSKYAWMTMQFSRGCPFQCEFCDIIVMFGRRPRTKPLDQVARELDALREMNVHNIFFVDDNLIGNPRDAKALLRFLIEYQEKHDYYFRFGTEASLNMAEDEELLDLFHRARFAWVFIGIESPDEASLREAKKPQNMRRDMLESIRNIYRHGIDVTGGFIVGFDSDTVDVFDRQYDFIVESGIRRAMIGLLVAMERTPLYQRLQEEGRLVAERISSDNSKLATNVVPRSMSYDELIEGYKELYHRLQRYPAIAERIRSKNRYLANPVAGNTRSHREVLDAVSTLVRHIAGQGGVSGLYHFIRSIPLTRPKLISQVFMDWIHELSTRDYIERHFVRESTHERGLAERHLSRIRSTLEGYLERGGVGVALSHRRDTCSEFRFSISGRLDREFFHRATQQLETMLSDTRSSLLLQIDGFDIRERHLLRAMLDRLGRYGDRIRIAADEASRRIIEVDSSVFTLVLTPQPLIAAPGRRHRRQTPVL